ncbi:hypothetical protein [Spirosoma sp. KNUC1025]|uniref:hypothetical protein n=1 Tax=Spirosoma sp. KNUC1025 TaxID=2894082 RepID=UPI0038660DFA|nr:hypothetical protein LN737_09205 [Spirosoma sp. KNUC1025]
MLQRLLFFKGWLLSGLFLLLGLTLLQAQPLPYSAAQRQQIEQLRQTIQKSTEAEV